MASFDDGTIRPAQLITTFGPGSFVQTTKDSVMIMGIDFWNISKFVSINHLYLEKITGCDHFKMPYAEEGKRTIACISFPRWGYCGRCKWLQRHKESLHRDRNFTCADHPKEPLLPARLIACCSRGHIGDFPWVEWAHSGPDHKPLCKSPKIKWHRGDRSSSITDSRVECDCGAYNYLRKAMKKEGITLIGADDKPYTYQCQGEQPWLRKQVNCTKISNNNVKSSNNNVKSNNETETAVGMIVRSTSLYYSKTVRAIIIPRLAHKVARFLQSEKYKNMLQYEVFRDLTIEKKAKEIYNSNNKDLGKEFDIDTIAKFIKLVEKEKQRKDIETEDDLKEIEYEELLISEVDLTTDKSDIIISNQDLNEKETAYFDVVKRLDLLTAIEVLRYFTRLKPPGEINNDEQENVKNHICYLATSGKDRSGRAHSRTEWLPCIIKKGEGIFIIFNKKFISSCLNDPNVIKRTESILKNYKSWLDQSGWPRSPNIDRQYILVHSLSHMLIKRLALHAGYNEASISERIYSSKNMCGVLIYTTSTGDGSLGGLVRQSTKLYNIFHDAMQQATSCSRDPTCSDTDPDDATKNHIPVMMAQNGSACYNCIMLPETSCECFNTMLDRMLLYNINNGSDQNG